MKNSSDKKSAVPQREHILAKASALFWEKGYTETSMKDIANACGFRPANIYNFFENKEAILFDILFEEMEQIIVPLREMGDIKDMDPRQGLRAIIEHHLRLTLGEKRSSKLLFDSGLRNLSSANQKKIIAMRDEYDSITAEVIERGIAEGVFSIAEPRLAVYSIASMIARSRIWYSPKGKYSVEDIIEFIYNFALRGLGAGDTFGKEMDTSQGN